MGGHHCGEEGGCWPPNGSRLQGQASGGLYSGKINHLYIFFFKLDEIYRVAAIFPEHFRSFTVALKNHLFYSLFRAKLSLLSVEAETKTNRHIPTKINQEEATRAVIVSRLRAAGVQCERLWAMKTSKEQHFRHN